MEKNYEALVFSVEQALVRGAVTQDHYDAVIEHIKFLEKSGNEVRVHKLYRLLEEIKHELGITKVGLSSIRHYDQHAKCQENGHKASYSKEGGK